MAFCPKCNGVMDTTAIVCPHCGYDFAPAQWRDFDFAHSPLANFALVFGAVASGLGCAACVIASVIALVNGQWVAALIGCPLAFIYQLAMLVVFLRVQRI